MRLTNAQFLKHKKHNIMTISNIIKKFTNKGYSVTRCNDSIIVTNHRGFKNSFSSYNAAFNYYF